MFAQRISLRVMVVVILTIDSIVASQFNIKQFDSESKYIVGGNIARVGQFPHQVFLLNMEIGNCAGSIISDRWVLTAAHCIQAPNSNVSRIAILVGASNINNTGEVMPLSQMISHSGYRGRDFYFEFDIALLKTKYNLEFSDTVQAIPLNQQHIGGAYRAVAIGWGFTERQMPSTDLKYTYTYTLENEQCREYDDLRDFVLSSTICSFLSIGAGICDGDSGGPLIAAGKLIGIASWARRPCGGGFPDGFTRMSSYIDWIEENSGLNISSI